MEDGISIVIDYPIISFRGCMLHGIRGCGCWMYWVSCLLSWIEITQVLKVIKMH